MTYRQKRIRDYWIHSGRKLPNYVGFTRLWGSEHTGRYWKRRLSKARRRAWKQGRDRGLAGIESTVNYRTW